MAGFGWRNSVCNSCERAIVFGNAEWVSWDSFLLGNWRLADGVGIAPTQPGGSLGFRDRGITALPTIRNGQGDLNCECRVQNAEWGQLRTECVEINSAFCTLNSAFEV